MRVWEEVQKGCRSLGEDSEMREAATRSAVSQYTSMCACLCVHTFSAPPTSPPCVGSFPPASLTTSRRGDRKDRRCALSTRACLRLRLLCCCLLHLP